MIQERHYPWDVLGIDKADNKKIIKKAYAKLIKQYKPDEHPNKFQEIQNAYMYALGVLKWGHLDEIIDEVANREKANTGKAVKLADVDKIVDKVVDKMTNHEIINTDNFNVTNATQNKSSEGEDAEEKIANDLINHLSKAFSQEQGSIDLIRDWNKFKQFNNILNIQLKYNLSNQIFGMIAQFNLEHEEDNSKPVINLSTIEYLDEIFDWGANWQDLLSRFPKKYIEIMLQRSNQKIDSKQFVTPLFSRALSFYLDYLFAIFMVFIIEWASLKIFTINYEKNTLSFLLISIFFLQRLLMESLFPSRRSIGKIVRNLYIVNLNGVYISFKKSLHRHYLIALNLTPYYLYQFQIKFDETVYFSIIVTIIAVNLISYFIKGCLLHDLLNKIKVLKPNE